MQFRTFTTMLILASALALGAAGAEQANETPAAADTPAEDHDQIRHRRHNMTDEEKQAVRERFKNMSDEEKQAMRERRHARRAAHRAKMRERWESMSDEERQAVRDRMKNRHGGQET